VESWQNSVQVLRFWSHHPVPLQEGLDNNDTMVGVQDLLLLLGLGLGLVLLLLY